MTKHRATARQWSGIERFVRYGAYDSCIIELRDRVEALEAAAKPVESNYPEKPDSSNAPESSDLLVDRVTDAIYSNATGGVRAAILAVADWLDQQELHIAATLVRQEVGQ
jgi:hypothetical protein